MDAPIVRYADFVELSDPKVPNSRQPYHDGIYVAREEGPALERLLASVNAYAQRSLDTLLSKYGDAGYRLPVAGLVVGSDLDPGLITNPHIRVHAAEGRLFRTVIEQALIRCGIAGSTFIERALFPDAVRVLKRSQAQLKAALAQLRPPVAKSWRAEEKAATLAAWLLLRAEWLKALS